MSTLKITPGPWSPGHIADDTTSCNCASIVSDYFAGSIAYVTVDNGKSIRDGGNDGPPLEQAKANSHLIAAAPDLYEALRISTAMLRTLIPPDISVRETLAENERVLARARGETS
jgi:hypothetical protein